MAGSERTPLASFAEGCSARQVNGGRRIRTSEGVAGGFTDPAARARKPLGQADRGTAGDGAPHCEPHSACGHLSARGEGGRARRSTSGGTRHRNNRTAGSGRNGSDFDRPPSADHSSGGMREPDKRVEDARQRPVDAIASSRGTSPVQCLASPVGHFRAPHAATQFGCDGQCLTDNSPRWRALLSRTAGPPPAHRSRRLAHEPSPSKGAVGWRTLPRRRLPGRARLHCFDVADRRSSRMCGSSRSSAS